MNAENSSSSAHSSKQPSIRILSGEEIVENLSFFPPDEHPWPPPPNSCFINTNDLLSPIPKKGDQDQGSLIYVEQENKEAYLGGHLPLSLALVGKEEGNTHPNNDLTAQLSSLIDLQSMEIIIMDIKLGEEEYSYKDVYRFLRSQRQLPALKRALFKSDSFKSGYYWELVTRGFIEIAPNLQSVCLEMPTDYDSKLLGYLQRSQAERLFGTIITKHPKCKVAVHTTQLSGLSDPSGSITPFDSLKIFYTQPTESWNRGDILQVRNKIVTLVSSFKDTIIDFVGMETAGDSSRESILASQLGEAFKDAESKLLDDGATKMEDGTLLCKTGTIIRLVARANDSVSPCDCCGTTTGRAGDRKTLKSALRQVAKQCAEETSTMSLPIHSDSTASKRKRNDDGTPPPSHPSHTNDPSRGA